MKNSSSSVFSLTAADGGEESGLPLRGVKASVEISGLLAVTRITQKFVNCRAHPIEAIYAFPLPLAATLLDLSIDIGGRKLDGVIRPKKDAELDYEAAVVSGDGAFLLRQLDDGQFQISVGNLRPDEECEIDIRYAEFLPAVNRSVRYRLPTAIAPRYGDSRRAGIDPLDAPTANLLVEHPFSMEILLRGGFAKADLASPTHDILVDCGAESCTVTLAKAAWLDRDFVLAIQRSEPPLLEAWRTPDGDAQAVLAAFHPPAPAEGRVTPRRLCVVVDCSGSMAGESIASVRRALRAIADRMSSEDRLSLVRFGNDVDIVTRKPQPMTLLRRHWLRRAIQALEADMGGTEIVAGVGKAMRVADPEADLLLITDGEANVSDEEISDLARRGHRIFTVGVGAAVAEKIVRRLADRSGGACELVTPSADMEQAIVNQFQRMALPPMQVRLDAGGAVDLIDARTVFGGETAVLLARIAADEAIGEVRVRAQSATETVEATHSLMVAQGMLADALPRVIAARRLASASDEEALQLALRYRLLTRQTAMVAIDRRAEDEKTDELPEMIQVPQMLAAGWGGVSVFRCHAPAMPSGSACMEDSLAPAFLRTMSHPAVASPRFARRFDDRIEIPEFLRASPAPSRVGLCSPLELAVQIQDDWNEADAIEAITWADFGDRYKAMYPETLHDKVSALEMPDGRCNEFALVLAFLAALIESLNATEARRVRPLHQKVLRTIAVVSVAEELLSEVRDAFSSVDSSCWGECVGAEPDSFVAQP
jgi:Ca-activated chloride channel family protein